MKSVGVAANAMVKEVGRQFKSADFFLEEITEEAVEQQILVYAAACNAVSKGREITAATVRHSAFQDNIAIAMGGNAPKDWRIDDPEVLRDQQVITDRSLEVGQNPRGKHYVNLIMAKLVVPMNAECIAISTDASLREMLPPAALVMFSPLLVGVLLGTDAVAGLLAGAICSSVQLAISSSNAGGAWDNAKKYVESGSVWLPREDGAGNRLPDPADGANPDGAEVTADDGKQYIRVRHAKGSELHKAAVAGDTVGDPFKDTSGPALNIVMKLMAILSLVFADFFMAINNGHGLLGGSTGMLPWPRLAKVAE